MRTIEDKNIPSRGGQVLIQVQLIHSLSFVTTMKKNKTPIGVNAGGEVIVTLRYGTISHTRNTFART